MARRKREKARAKPRGKAAPKKTPKKPTKKPHKLTFSERVKKVARSLSAAPAKPRAKKRAAPKAAPKARQKGAQKPPQKAAPKPRKVAAKKSGPKGRNYKKEYQRRVERAQALGYSKSVARGHPRKGEVGREELAQMRRAIHVLTPGQQKALGIKRPVSAYLRVTTRERVAEIAGVELPADKTEASRRTSDSAKFAEAFLNLGLGTKSQGYTLWFSP